jgi:hypothetical protein
MSWRSAVSVALLCSVALACWASLASATLCLPSASAVREGYPGAWPSWTLRAEGHEGAKCWYPATRPTAAGHPREAPSQVEAPTQVETPSQVQAAPENASVTVEAAPTGPSPITATETYGVGSGPQNTAGVGSGPQNTAGVGSGLQNTASVGSGPQNTAGVGSGPQNTAGVESGPQDTVANAGSISALEESSFLDRFAAVYAHDSFGDSSLRRYLVGRAMTMSEVRGQAVPDISP